MTSKSGKMKCLVIFCLMVCLAAADSSNKQEIKAKPTPAPLNSISPSQKPELYYTPMNLYSTNQPLQLQAKPQYIPIQIIPKPYYMPQSYPQPQAMIIIAQPALVPSSLLYGSPSPLQQLLNYFHTNPQARYQLLHGQYQSQPQVTQPQPQPQPQQHPQSSYVHQVVAAAPPLSNYIMPATPTPPPTPQYQQYQQYQQFQHYPNHLEGLSQLAQLAAQQYAASPMRQAPAIVTGFENFTPEQQANIKAQLSNHLGTNFHAVSATPSTNKFSSQYITDATREFTPSQQIKNDIGSTSTTDSIGSVMKTTYTKM